MPKNRKRYGTGGGGLDLGAIFSAVGEAGVKDNPDFGKEPGQVDYRYSGDPNKLVRQPVKATNIFAKPGAAKFNSEFSVGQAEENAKTRREIDLESNKTGELNKRGINETAQLKERAITDLLRTEGLEDTPDNRSMFHNALSETRIAAKKAQAESEALAGMDVSDKIRTGLDTRALTKSSTQQTDVNKARLGQMQSEADVTGFPASDRIKTRLEEMGPALELAKIRYFGSGTGLRGAQEQKLEQPNFMENYFKNQMNNTIQTKPSPTVNLAPSPTDDFEYRIIGGKTYRIPRTK